MKNEDVKIGMKVVPFQKTVADCGDLETSVRWKMAKENNQPYLYVREKLNSKAWKLSNEIDFGADYFNACDFEPYTENRNNKKENSNMKIKKGDYVYYKGTYGYEVGKVDNVEVLDYATKIWCYYSHKEFATPNELPKTIEEFNKIEKNSVMGFMYKKNVFPLELQNASMANSTLLHKGKIKYKVDENKTTTVKSNKKIGIAKFNPEDEFDLTIGVTIGYLRSQGVSEDKIWDIVDILQCNDVAYKRLKEKESEMKVEEVKEPEYEVFNASQWQDFLNNKLVVNCRTEEDANEFLKILDSMGIIWDSGKKLLVDNNWGYREEQTCYRCEEGRIYYSCDDFYKDDYKIVAYKKQKQQ